jgi:hypothetical protein
MYFSIDAYMLTICVHRCPTWWNHKPLWKYVAGSSLLTCTRTRGGSSRESPQVNTTYIDTYIHTYIHTYTIIHPRINSLDTYIHTYRVTFLSYDYFHIFLVHKHYRYIHTVHTYIHTYIHTVHTYIHTYIHTYYCNIVMTNA